MCSVTGAGIVTFGTRVVLALRKASARTIGLARQRIGPVIHSRDAACCAPLALRQAISVVPARSAANPSQFMISSSHQLRRRNSPSVTALRPTRSCMATAARMQSSSIARSSPSSCGPRWRSAVCAPSRRSRASLSFCGRSRLPTWSARNGGRGAGRAASSGRAMRASLPHAKSASHRPGVVRAVNRAS